ncbi:lactate/malate family dehydrogenase [Streptomyces sp. NPDC055722]
MKVGVIGVGAAGSATMLSLVERGGTCREIVVIDRDSARAAKVAADMRYAAPLSPTVDVRCGGYDDLADAAVVVITAGVNEKAGGATDRSDPQGRLPLLETNAEVYADIVAKVVAVAPQAVLMVVTDPPDPLADLTLQLAGHDRVFSAGTLIDSLQFRVQLADRPKIRPRDVQALVVGEHGTSEVLLVLGDGRRHPRHRSARGDRQVPGGGAQGGRERHPVRQHHHHRGHGGQQYGIGAVSARLVEAVLRDERAVLPVAARSSATTSPCRCPACWVRAVSSRCTSLR